MKNFIVYLMFLITSYLFCVALTLGFSYCFNLPSPIGIATLIWACACFSLTIFQ